MSIDFGLKDVHVLITGAAGGMTGSSMGGSGITAGDSTLPPAGGRSTYDQQQGYGSQSMGKDVCLDSFRLDSL